MKILRSQSTDEFVNWSRSLRFTLGSRVRPDSEAALQVFVRDAAARQRKLRVAGSGHSSSPLVCTAGMLVSLEQMRGLLDYDSAACQATVAPGTVLEDLGRLLHGVGLGMENLGEVDTQTIAGVVSTGQLRCPGGRAIHPARYQSARQRDRHDAGVARRLKNRA